MLAPALLAAALASGTLSPEGPQAPGSEPSVTALRVREAVRVDGLLDDPAWSRAEAASGFRQREPREGAAATEATEVRVLYDETTSTSGCGRSTGGRGR